jgi:hypothetical protein
VAVLEELGFEEVRVTARFDCFRATTKERTAKKYGVRGANIFARKPALGEPDYRSGWGAGIRTPIGRSRVCSLTIRRPPRTVNFILARLDRRFGPRRVAGAPQALGPRREPSKIRVE